MQILWSKILAGEANRPGTFSRRTLGIVSEFDKKDAVLFTMLGKLTFMMGPPTIVVFDCQNELYTKNGITFSSLTHLESLGLIRFDNLAGYIRQKIPKSFAAIYFGEPVLFEMMKDADNDLPIGNVILTQPGIELIRICGSSGDKEILEYTKNKWKEKGIKIIDQ